MATHANTTDTLPKHRYQNGIQNYHFDSPREVTLVRDSDTRFIAELRDLGIAAGELTVDGTPVYVQGTVSIPRACCVVHDPTYGKRGKIDIQTQY